MQDRIGQDRQKPLAFTAEPYCRVILDGIWLGRTFRGNALNSDHEWGAEQPRVMQTLPRLSIHPRAPIHPN